MCTDAHIPSNICAKIYEDRGLSIEHGEKVTATMFYKAWDILKDHIDELNRPATLEALAGNAVHEYTPNHSVRDLPLPRVVVDNIIQYRYQKEVRQYTLSADYIFVNPQVLNLPMTLKQHIGQYVITEWHHPYPL